MQTQPAHDELEVSIFGPGIGECIVLHVGNGKWIVIDSCRGPGGRAVALEYLADIRVDTSQVTAVVVTHWHDDHTAGLAEIVAACPTADFFCSGALCSREFFQLIACVTDLELRAGCGSGVDEMARVFDVLKTRKRGGRTVSPFYAAENTVLFRREHSSDCPAVAIEALSPSSTSKTRAFASLVPHLFESKKAFANPGPNELSVAMHVMFGETSVLLGSDLEVGSSDEVGWRAVVANTRRPSAKAQIVKVSHHGSVGADHEPAWAALVANRPRVAVTSFNSSGLPRADDIARLRARASQLFRTSSSTPKNVSFANRATQRTLEGIAIRDRVNAMGHVRFRVRSNLVDVQTFGAASGDLCDTRSA